MIVFLSLYLGLVSGKQPLALQADAGVASIRILLDGVTVATLTAPPWRAEVDFGPALLPHEIVAVALNAKGDELARASQFVNVPRANAEIDVVLTRDAAGVPTRAKLVGRHLAQQPPRSAAFKLDDAPLAVHAGFEATLPAVDMTRPHVLAAEMRFDDDTVARREVAFGGQFAESAETQLTPVAVGQAGACAPLHVRSVDDASALVIVVRDPDPREINNRLRRGAGASTAPPPVMLDAGLDVYRTPRQATTRVDSETKTAPLGDEATSQLLSPVANPGAARGDVTTLFPMSPLFRAGMYFVLTRPHMSAAADAPRRWADAVAVAGVRAATGGRRRAVVLVLGSGADKSEHQAADVRKYLAAIGVPLFVWSTEARRSDWGTVEDISSAGKLGDATERLRHALDTQRIAWIEADPLTAMRACYGGAR
jgi:hypothetical protein